MTVRSARRVLAIIHGPVYGGGHNNVIQLHGPLLERGWEIIAMGPTEPGNAVRLTREAGVEMLSIPLHRLRATAAPRVHAAFVRGLRPEIEAIRRVIRDRSIDVVMAHGPTNPHAAIAADLEGAAVAWQFYDTRAPMPLRLAAMPLVLRLTDVLIVWGQKLVEEHPGAARLGERVIPVMPPVDSRLFAPSDARRTAARDELAVRDGALVVGTVGNRNPSKGHHHLVRAAARLRASHPHAAVRVLGAPSPVHAAYEERVRAEARAGGLGDPATFSMVDPGRRVPELIHAFDVFALTSVPRSEGLPTVLLEAMAAGLPVVATDVAAVAEVVEDGVTGFVVPAEDEDAIAGALARLAADPALRRRLGEEGRRRVLERYDIGPLADRYAHAYEIAFEHRRRRGRPALAPPFRRQPVSG